MQRGVRPRRPQHILARLTHAPPSVPACVSQPAFQPHPDSGERTWFNHLGVLHSAAWADEFVFAAAHLDSFRYAAIAAAFYLLDAVAHGLLGPDALGQHVTHRGSRPIEPRHLWHVRRLVWRHTIVQPWQQAHFALPSLPASVGEAFALMFNMERACRAQLAIMSSGGRQIRIAEELAEDMPKCI